MVTSVSWSHCSDSSQNKKQACYPMQANNDWKNYVHLINEVPLVPKCPICYYKCKEWHMDASNAGRPLCLKQNYNDVFMFNNVILIFNYMHMLLYTAKANRQWLEKWTTNALCLCMAVLCCNSITMSMDVVICFSWPRYGSLLRNLNDSWMTVVIRLSRHVTGWAIVHSSGIEHHTWSFFLRNGGN